MASLEPSWAATSLTAPFRWNSPACCSASGNAKLLNLASNYASVITMVTAGKVLYAVALPAAVFGIIGHLLGSGMALKKGAKFIRPMMLCVLVLLLADLVGELLA